MRVGNPRTTQRTADENLYAEEQPIAEHFRRGVVLDHRTKELRAARDDDMGSFFLNQGTSQVRPDDDMDFFVNPRTSQVHPEDVMALYAAAAKSPKTPKK